jgi:hypothetical protein
MKEALECLDKASYCDMLARRTRDASSTQLLSDISDQWRRLAHDTDRHKRQIGRPRSDSPRDATDRRV